MHLRQVRLSLFLFESEQHYSLMNMIFYRNEDPVYMELDMNFRILCGILGFCYHHLSMPVLFRLHDVHKVQFHRDGTPKILCNRYWFLLQINNLSTVLSFTQKSIRCFLQCNITLVTFIL